MVTKRPYSKESSLFWETNQTLGYGAGGESGGYSVTFLDDKVILINPSTGEITVLTREEWNALPVRRRQEILRDELRYQRSIVPADQSAAALNFVGGFIVMANTNIITDDNFDIYIGGEFIYSVDFTPDGVNGHFAAFGNVNVGVAKDAIKSEVPLDTYVLDTVVRRPLGAYPTETSTIFMENTRDNGSGNFGYIWCGFTKYGKAFFDKVPYSPSNGQDFTTQVTWPQVSSDTE